MSEPVIGRITHLSDVVGRPRSEQRAILTLSEAKFRDRIVELEARLSAIKEEAIHVHAILVDRGSSVETLEEAAEALVRSALDEPTPGEPPSEEG